MKIKVGMMPGRLTEVTVEESLTAREIFDFAGVEVSNHEVRLDGEKIDMDTVVERGGLLVAMKMIKGNAKTIKVGMMPGRLEVIEFTEGETVRDIFSKTNLELANHEIRLDGERVDMETVVNNGSLLVAMKMIKGNSDVYVTDCTEEEIAMLLNVQLPREIAYTSTHRVGGNFIEVAVGNELIVVEEDMFDSVYELVEEIDIKEICEEVDIQEVPEMRNPIEVIVEEIESLEKLYDMYTNQAIEVKGKISILEDILRKINNF